jgi:hypothetical protein
MDIRLPIPKNWQDFESICHRLWSEIWNDTNAQKNGRQGQAQAGVDVFGKPFNTTTYQGVQCKDKDSKLGSKLTDNDLFVECTNAINFKPQISNFTLATTSPRDEGIQEFYRSLNNDRKFPFEVSVWSWDDIEAEIAYRPAIINHYYPLLKSFNEDSNKIKLNRYSTKDHLKAFFARPILNETLSKKFKSYLQPLIYELADNSYLYGQGTLFEIEINNNKIVLIDNGKEFNPLTQLDANKVSSKSNVGSFVLKTFLNKFSGHITATYKREGNINFLIFDTDDTILKIDDDSHFEITIDLHLIYGREAVRNLIKDIPSDKADILINVEEVGALSSFVELTRETLEKLNKSQTLTLSLPRHEYLNEMKSWFDDDRLNIKTR